MTRLQDYTLIGSAAFGIATIVLGTIMLFTFPMSAELSEGFTTPIIAFEFARTEADLAFLTGTSDASTSNREAMDAGHVWDMGFPFAYAGFLAFLLLQVASQGHRFAWLGLLFAVAIIPFDINENLTLLRITEALAHGASAVVPLSELHTATWLKWGAIGLGLGVLAAGLFANREYKSATASLLTAGGIAACKASDSAPAVAEVMSVLVFAFFLAFTLKACVQSWALLRART